MKAAGMKVPEDIYFASFDDVIWFDITTLPLTAVAQPIEELGSAVAWMLAEKQSGRGGVWAS